jgi:hypothetical protein
MSNRHRSSKEATPGAAHPAPSKEERKAANRKVRHRTHELLAHADLEIGEEIVDPVPVHTRLDGDPGDLNPRTGRPRREYRHWKQKFWKRRNNVRQQRALQYDAEMPLPEIS